MNDKSKVSAVLWAPPCPRKDAIGRPCKMRLRGHPRHTKGILNSGERYKKYYHCDAHGWVLRTEVDEKTDMLQSSIVARLKREMLVHV